MSQVLGRDETCRWPGGEGPVWTITALALTVVACWRQRSMSTERGEWTLLSASRIWGSNIWQRSAAVVEDRAVYQIA